MDQISKSQWLDYAKLKEIYINLKGNGYEDLSIMVDIALDKNPEGGYVKNLFDKDTIQELNVVLKYY
jgi:hypothetical protein